MTRAGGDSHVFALPDGSQMRWQDTPWNDVPLQLRTLEITEFPEARSGDWTSGLLAFDKWMVGEGYDLATIRVRADRHSLIAVLQSIGYDYVESSLRLSLGNVIGFAPPPRLGRPAAVREATVTDLPALQRIASEDFHHGRFLEDSRIPAERSRERQRQWVANLLEGQSRILTHDGPTGPDCFMALRQHDESVWLELGGCARQARLYAVPFWLGVIRQLQDDRVLRVHTTISVGNTGVMNLYSALGFRAVEALVGLHRHAYVDRL